MNSKKLTLLVAEYKRLQKEYDKSEGINRILLRERLSGIQTGYELGTGESIGSLLLHSSTQNNQSCSTEWNTGDKYLTSRHKGVEERNKKEFHDFWIK